MHDAGITISNSDLKRLLACANADAALLYLYLAAGNDPAQAQTALRMSQSRLDLAAASLRQMGLTQDEPKHLAPAEAPGYTEQDVTREYRTNPEFPSMVGEAQRRLGRLLSTEEIKILLSVYRYLGLPPEVISILINYCIQRSRARGQTRMPSIRSIEKEAYRWADLGVDTMEEAAVYMQSQLQLQANVGKIQSLLGIEGRKLTAGEEKLIAAWLSWGFGEREIRLAYEKTCMNTGGLKWPYLNSILKSWHEQGLTTLERIEAGDRPPENRRAARQSPAITCSITTTRSATSSALPSGGCWKTGRNNVWRTRRRSCTAPKRGSSRRAARTSSTASGGFPQSMKSCRVWRKLTAS